MRHDAEITQADLAKMPEARTMGAVLFLPHDATIVAAQGLVAVADLSAGAQVITRDAGMRAILALAHLDTPPEGIDWVHLPQGAMDGLTEGGLCLPAHGAVYHRARDGWPSRGQYAHSIAQATQAPAPTKSAAIWFARPHILYVNGAEILALPHGAKKQGDFIHNL